MATIKHALGAFAELVDFFAERPSIERILAHHPSKALQRRASFLLAKCKAGKRLTDDEQREMDDMVQAESFMGLLKARLHAHKAARA